MCYKPNAHVKLYSLLIISSIIIRFLDLSEYYFLYLQITDYSTKCLYNTSPSVNESAMI